MKLTVASTYNLNSTIVEIFYSIFFFLKFLYCGNDCDFIQPKHYAELPLYKCRNSSHLERALAKESRVLYTYVSFKLHESYQIDHNNENKQTIYLPVEKFLCIFSEK